MSLIKFENIQILTPQKGDAKSLGNFAAQNFTKTFGHVYHIDDLNEFLSQKYNDDAVLNLINDAQIFLKIAKYNGEIIGYIMGGPMSLPYKADIDAFELQRLYVSEAAKGTGLAFKLYQELLNYAKSIRATELYLGVWAHNERALKFYSGLGFEIVGKYLYQVGRTFDDERIMRIKL